MWRFIRNKHQEFGTPFANDCISAVGTLPGQTQFIRYQITQTFAVAFEEWIQAMREGAQKISNIPTIYSVCVTDNHHECPMLYMIAPVHPFGALRFLSHPLARECPEMVPWLYRRTIEVFEQFLAQDFSRMSMETILRQIDNFKVFNSRLMRKSVSEGMIYQLKRIKFQTYWPTLALKQVPTDFLLQMTQMLKHLKRGNYNGIRLPLSQKKEWLLASVVFWMQLLTRVLKHKFYEAWQVVWQGKSIHHSASLVFYQGSLSPEKFVNLWELPFSSSNNDIADMMRLGNTAPHSSHVPFEGDADISLFDLLVEWGKVF